jgi:hypothetical protein
MRTVEDAHGATWICLELPDDRDARDAATVHIECNSGADRVVISAPRGWDDNWTDDELLAAINALAQRPAS